jgi:predicted XRE-type DNA-binding protein
MSEFDETSLESASSWNDAEDNHSIAGRARIRAQLAADIQAFLTQGGQIQEVDTSFRADAPRKVDVGFNNRSLS